MRPKWTCHYDKCWSGIDRTRVAQLVTHDSIHSVLRSKHSILSESVERRISVGALSMREQPSREASKERVCKEFANTFATTAKPILYRTLPANCWPTLWGEV